MMYFQTHLVVIAVVVVVLTAVVAYLCVMGARRLDRLHQRILANRDALSRLLVRRASETLLLAREDALGRRAGACLTEVANASVADSADQLSCDGLDRRSGAAPAAVDVGRRRRPDPRHAGRCPPPAATASGHRSPVEEAAGPMRSIAAAELTAMTRLRRDGIADTKCGSFLVAESTMRQVS